jgi:hypothetical protein
MSSVVTYSQRYVGRTGANHFISREFSKGFLTINLNLSLGISLETRAQHGQIVVTIFTGNIEPIVYDVSGFLLFTKISMKS